MAINRLILFSTNIRNEISNSISFVLACIQGLGQVLGRQCLQVPQNENMDHLEQPDAYKPHNHFTIVCSNCLAAHMESIFS